MDGQYVTREEFSKLDGKMDELQDEQTQTKQRSRHVEQKLDKIEINTTWILRLIFSNKNSLNIHKGSLFR
ncbi:hypothetical protein SAMN04487936_11565 [Halobacillus dabanensis]|uniref:Uncharacterized protein n=1 Tax=Halobacillus dabanensis TaxID=240302 RepID=A0A1I3ZZI1_HALDA|nr:hypothetical protein [Halobacillus dabanensis]SFK49330.1 hypothetical protein SAMN04487936_11565 [Halobacillus dabanensis]